MSLSKEIDRMLAQLKKLQARARKAERATPRKPVARKSRKPVARKGLEARAWLAVNGNRAPMRNLYHAQAVEFVDKLYHLGARRVEVFDVYDEPDRIRREGGPYTRALRIYASGAALKRIISFVTDDNPDASEVIEKQTPRLIEIDLKYANTGF